MKELAPYTPVILITIICIVEILVTKKPPSTAWLYIAYGIYKILVLISKH